MRAVCMWFPIIIQCMFNGFSMPFNEIVSGYAMRYLCIVNRRMSLLNG